MIASAARHFLMRPLAAALLLCGCLGAYSGTAQAQVPISSDLAGNPNAVSTAPSTVAEQPEPLVASAMKTLPQATEKWSACYADCVKKNECTASICAHECVGRVIQLGFSSNIASQIMRYNALGIYGGSCIGDFREYLDTIKKAGRAAHSLGDIQHFIQNQIIDKIIDQIEYQIFSQIMNSVCQVTTELMNSADSFVKNAICLPTGALNPFSFDLNLGRMQCDGWSVNALTGQVSGTPVSGLPFDATGLFTATPATPVTVAPVTAPAATVPTAGTPVTLPPVTKPQ